MRPNVKRMMKIGAITAVGLVFAGVAYTLGASGVLDGGGAGTSGSVAPTSAVDEYAAQYGAGSRSSLDVAEESAKIAPVPPSDGAADLAKPGDSVIIRTAGMTIRVEAMDDAIEKVRTLVSQAKAEITDLYIDEGSNGGPIPLAEGSTDRYPSTANITIRVPAEGLDALQKKLAEVGVVTSQSASSSDVTEQHIDMTARLKNLQAQEAQLRAFFKDATKVTELLAIEQELSRVRGEIESLQAQIEYLERQAARATLTVTLTEPGSIVSPAGPTWGVSEAIRNGLRGAMAIVNGTITLTIALAPFAVIAFVLFLVVRAVSRRRAARRAAMPQADEPGEV